MNFATWQLLAGVSLDLVFGDPRWLPHPVRWFGWMAARLERVWRGIGLPLRFAGVCFWASCIGIAGTAVWATIWVTTPWLSVYWIWVLLALRDLDFEAGLVIRELRNGDLAAAREKLSMIVGRDTGQLDEAEVVRAVLETVAENLSDAVIAPLFYLAIAGPAGMAVYKAANTLDSTVGYRNPQYLQFGWASARMDDLLNLIPARISAVLVWICAGVLRLNARQSVSITMRDGATQPSPNAGYPEAAFAGALQVRLGGLNYYGGVASSKPYLGDAIRPLTSSVFPEARKLLYGSAALMVAATMAVLR